MEIDRNTIEGFAHRVRKNLAYMSKAASACEDVHIVTQLTCSLLGLIVFPYEHFKRNGFLDFHKRTMSELAAEGWPRWTFHLDNSHALDSHLFHLRNALSHRRVRFSSDGRVLADVVVTFSDRRPMEHADYWSASIDGVGLLEFVGRLSDLLDWSR